MDSANYNNGNNHDYQGHYDANGNWVTIDEHGKEVVYYGYYDDNGNWVDTSNAGNDNT